MSTELAIKLPDNVIQKGEDLELHAQTPDEMKLANQSLIQWCDTKIKSVELLSEMERKAEERIISVNRLKNNVLDAIWYVRDDPMNMELVATCKLKINGREHELKVNVDRPWRKEHAEQVVHGICEQVTRELMKMCFTQTQFVTLLTR